ncbi:MAG TPA: hypothetical protein VGH31_10470, partial [Acidimicrobiales bacterium]
LPLALDRSRTGGRSSRVRRMASSPHLVPVVLVILAVVAANGLYLFHILDPNPINVISKIGTVTKPGYLVGQPALDPNTGFTAQSLGHLVALDWLHGHIGWWNPYEGLGTPLAGEMQSGVFFPPTLLLYFSNGQVYSHALIEMVAGLSTYFLLARMGLGRIPSLAGGVAFALTSAYAWFSHAPTNPIAFLPLLLLGIEGAARATDWRHSWGWVTIAVALALSLGAGFPETAYCDGLVAAFWVVARAIGLRRLWWPFVARVLLGATVGLLLAAPILVAFLDYLEVSFVGGHDGVFSGVSLPHAALAQEVTPYIFGPIAAFSGSDSSGTLASVWGNTGGFLSAATIILALIGLYGSRYRAVRIGLVAWVVFALGRSFGVTPFLQIVNDLPAMRSVAFYRYANPSWDLALIVLAALGLDDVIRKLVPRWWILLCTLVTLLMVYLARLGASGTLAHLHKVGQLHLWTNWSVVWALGITIAICAIALQLRNRVGAALLCALVCLDAIGMFVVPQLSASRSAHIETGAVHYLQQHAGLSRFYTFGPLGPNYGSYFGISSLNANDLPTPKLFASFVTTHLDTDAYPTIFNGNYRDKTPGPSSVVEFFKHLSAFENAGVKYFITNPGFVPPADEGIHRVYADSVDDVFSLPHPQPMFEVTSGGGCFTDQRAIDTVDLLCGKPATIVRHELYMKGWSATVNGRSVPVTRDGPFQEIRVLRGGSRVHFTYAPPHLAAAVVAFLLGLLLLLPLPLLLRRRPRAVLDGVGWLRRRFDRQ